MSAKVLKLGVIGLSEGNGHPYSWSAICNGYDPHVMQSCPFPAIPEYLAPQRFPEDALSEVQVTHIWTQDRASSEHVAAAAWIPHVVDRFESMIGKVDGVLLARDDPENHLSMSLPFLRAGLPVYIDKPITTSLSELDKLYAHQQYAGQIFSCSALRYAGSLRLDDETRARIGAIHHVDAVVPKSWRKYGVHIIDPVLQNLGLHGERCDVSASSLYGVHVVTARWDAVSATFTCLGELPSQIVLRYFGANGVAECVFSDTFAAFREALRLFVEGARTRREITSRAELESMVSILERGFE